MPKIMFSCSGSCSSRRHWMNAAGANVEKSININDLENIPQADYDKLIS